MCWSQPSTDNISVLVDKIHGGNYVIFTYTFSTTFRERNRPSVTIHHACILKPVVEINDVCINVIGEKAPEDSTITVFNWDQASKANASFPKNYSKVNYGCHLKMGHSEYCPFKPSIVLRRVFR